MWWFNASKSKVATSKFQKLILKNSKKLQNPLSPYKSTIYLTLFIEYFLHLLIKNIYYTILND